MKHENSFSLAGQTVKIKAGAKHPQVPDFGGSSFRIEDYWDKVSGGKSWMEGASEGNMACVIYSIRVHQEHLPMNSDVLYGKIGPFGHLVHLTELDL